jgi:hypothetical protein
MEDLVMAVIGAQYLSSVSDNGTGISTIKKFMSDVPAAARPSFWETASVVDKRGASNKAVLAYWSSVKEYERWETQSGFRAWWRSSERESDGHGWFQEILYPTVDRFETIF